MKKAQLPLVLLVLCLGAAGAWFLLRHDDHAEHDHHDAHEHDHDHAHHAPPTPTPAAEARVTIAPDHAASAGLVVGTAGPATISSSLTLHGSIRPDANRIARIHARFPGLVREVRRQLGDAVAPGDVLAIVESNDSLQSYEIKSPAAGIVTERNANPGSVAATDPLFVVTDFSHVWVELNAFAGDLPQLTPGLPVALRTADGAVTGTAPLTAPLPQAAPASQSRLVRLSIANPDGRWAPGLRVTGAVQLPPHEARVAVRTTAIQHLEDHPVVFVQQENAFVPRRVKLGRADATHVEVLDGLAPGERYVATNSFLVKADALKSGAAHDH